MPDFKPLGLKPTVKPEATDGDFIQDTNETASKVDDAFQKERKFGRRQKFLDTVLDSEYWFCVCFTSREQKEAFLRAAGLYAHGDKYLSGYVVAEKLGIELPDAELPPEKPVDPKYAALARPPKKGK